MVTGSRIRRIDMEEARPAVVITREDIELSGRESVADVLRNNPVNSLGSSRERSGSPWIGQATIDLHGLGANRTLVLLDGRRMPRSPVTANQAVDLNIIPLAAVERVEILTDSASAIYGSDAIGGVVNIILRKYYEGMEVRASADRPAREGADTESGVLTLGGATDRGRFLFSADFRNKEHIASADRFYTLGTTGYAAGAADYPDAPFPATWTAWEDADNVSSWGNTIWPRQLAAPNCEQAVDPATGRRVLAGPYIAANGEEHCGFHYALSAWETTDLKRASVFLHADYELTPAHALRVQSLFSTQNVHGRFAPPPGDIPLSEAARAGLKHRFGFDVPYTELLPYTLRHRFTGMGDREFKALLQLSEHALLAYGGAGYFDYELEVRHTRYHGREDSCCFPKAFTTSEFVAQGRYNPFDPLNPGNADALAGIRANSSRDSRADFRSFSGNVGFDMFRAPGGPLSWAFGFDLFDEKYRDIYDPLSAGGDLLGRLGIDGQGERLIKAVFGEALVPVLPGLELSAALRWDQYDDSAGSELSSYLSVRYQPTRWLLLRASWGEGFRAGSMNNLYDGTALHLQTSFDLVKCRRDGIAPSDCIEGEFPTYTGGNPALRPELSDSYNLGAVMAIGSLTARVDYWSVDLENGISLPPLQGLIGLEYEGQCANTGRTENTRYTGRDRPLRKRQPAQARPGDRRIDRGRCALGQYLPGAIRRHRFSTGLRLADGRPWQLPVPPACRNHTPAEEPLPDLAAMELGHRHGLRSGRGCRRPALGPQLRRDHLALRRSHRFRVCALRGRFRPAGSRVLDCIAHGVRFFLPVGGPLGRQDHAWDKEPHGRRPRTRLILLAAAPGLQSLQPRRPDPLRQLPPHLLTGHNAPRFYCVGLVRCTPAPC